MRIQKLMVSADLKFIEVAPFRLDDYIPHIGWIAVTPTILKIYRRENSKNYFLHDELRDRLFEFAFKDELLRDRSEYEKVVSEYNKLRLGFEIL